MPSAPQRRKNHGSVFYDGMTVKRANELWVEAKGIIDENGNQAFPPGSSAEEQAVTKEVYRQAIISEKYGELGLAANCGIVPPGIRITSDGADGFHLAGMNFNGAEVENTMGEGASRNINQRIVITGKDAVTEFFGGDGDPSVTDPAGRRHGVDSVALYITGAPMSDDQKAECSRGEGAGPFHIPTHHLALVYFGEKDADGQIDETGVAIGVMDRNGDIYFPGAEVNAALGLAAPVSSEGFRISQKDLEKVECNADTGEKLTEGDFGLAHFADIIDEKPEGYESPNDAMMRGLKPDDNAIQNAETAIDALREGAGYAKEIAATIDYVENHQYESAADVLEEKLGAVLDAGDDAGKKEKATDGLYAAIKDVQGALITSPDGKNVALWIADAYEKAAGTLEKTANAAKDADGKDIAGAYLALHLANGGIETKDTIERIEALVYGADSMAAMAYEDAAELAAKDGKAGIDRNEHGEFPVLRGKDGTVPGMEEFLKAVGADAEDRDFSTAGRADADGSKNAETGEALTAILDRIASTNDAAAALKEMVLAMWGKAADEILKEREPVSDRPDIDPSGSAGKDRDDKNDGLTGADAEDLGQGSADNDKHGGKRNRPDSGGTKHGGAKVDTEKDIQVSDAKIAEIREQYGKDADEKVAELRQELNEIAKDIKHYAEIKDACEKVLPFRLLRSYLPYLQATYGLDGAVAAAARLGAAVGAGWLILEVPTEKDFLQDRSDIYSCDKATSNAIGAVYEEIPGLRDVRYRPDGELAEGYSDYLDFSLRTARLVTAWKLYVRMGWGGLIRYFRNKNALTVEMHERDAEARGADDVSKDRDGSAETAKEDSVDGKAGAEKNPYLGLGREEYKEAEAKVGKEGEDLERRRNDLTSERDSLDKEKADVDSQRKDLARDRAGFLIDEATGDGEQKDMEARRDSLDEREKKLDAMDQELKGRENSLEAKEKAFEKDEAAHEKNAGWLKEASIEQERNDITKDREQAHDISDHSTELKKEVAEERHEQKEAQADIDARKADAESILGDNGATEGEKLAAQDTLDGLEDEQKGLDGQKALTDEKDKRADREQELAAAILAICESREDRLEKETGDTADKEKDGEDNAGHVETEGDAADAGEAGKDADPMEGERQNDSLGQTGDLAGKTDDDGSTATVSTDKDEDGNGAAAGDAEQKSADGSTDLDGADGESEDNDFYYAYGANGMPEEKWPRDDSAGNERAERLLDDIMGDPEALERFCDELIKDAGVDRALDAYAEAHAGIEGALEAMLNDPDSGYSGVDSDKASDLISDAALRLANDLYDDAKGIASTTPDAGTGDTGAENALDIFDALLSKDPTIFDSAAEDILKRLNGDSADGGSMETNADTGDVEPAPDQATTTDEDPVDMPV